MDSQPNSTRQEHGKKWIFIISGIILFLIVTIIGTTIITCNKQYSWNSSSNQAELPYSQSSQFLVTGSLSVEPPSTSEVDYTWTYDENYPDMNFILEIQGTSNQQQDPTQLDWSKPVITKTLSSNDYKASGNSYSYTLIDDQNILIYGTYYWSRIQISADISSAWDYSTAYFQIEGSCENASNCNNLSGDPNTLYKTDPMSQAIYYGFCRYADDVSQCMQDASSRYTTDGNFGTFSSNVLPGASCYPVSPSDPINVCAPPLPPFAARVKSSDGDGGSTLRLPVTKNWELWL